MSVENPGSILICKDAGTAGRTLLARHDLRVRWALTTQEAEAVIRQTKCTVCITRESLAKPVLAACAKAGREITTIVLLEPNNSSGWREYFEAGATSVLQTTAADQLMEAMADATGLSFRTAPRIPFKTEVRFALGDEGGVWRSHNLSSTGICIVEFPPYALGSEVDLAFELSGKRFEFNAVVSQILRVGATRGVGLAFRDVSPELQAHLNEVIRSIQSQTRAIAEPEAFDAVDAADEHTVLNLRSSNAHGDAVTLVHALTSDGKVAGSQSAEYWLVAACEAFSTIEVAAIRNPKGAPAWAQDAMLARLRVYQTRAAAANPSDADMREIFGLCQRLAETAAGADEASLVQVANIRAEILRALYDPDLLDEL